MDFSSWFLPERENALEVLDMIWNKEIEKLDINAVRGQLSIPEERLDHQIDSCCR